MGLQLFCILRRHLQTVEKLIQRLIISRTLAPCSWNVTDGQSISLISYLFRNMQCFYLVRCELETGLVPSYRGRIVTGIYCVISCLKDVNSDDLDTCWTTKIRTGLMVFFGLFHRPVFQWLRLALCKGPNWVGVFSPPFIWGRKQIQFPKRRVF
jgi:hypothetical protein